MFPNSQHSKPVLPDRHRAVVNHGIHHHGVHLFRHRCHTYPPWGEKYQQSMFILIKNVLLRAFFKVFLQFRFFVVIDMIPSTHRVTDSVLAVVNCHGQSRNLAWGGGGKTLQINTLQQTHSEERWVGKGHTSLRFFCPQDWLSDLQGYSSIVPTENILFHNKKQINFNDK